MICKFCGNVIEDNSDYCFICGQKVVNEAPAYAAEVYSQQPQGAPAQPVAAPAPVAEQPVYAAPVAPVQQSGKKAKKTKKNKKEKAPANPAELSKGEKFLIGFLAAVFLAVGGVLFAKNFIGLLVCAVATGVVAYVYYVKYKKAMDGGYEEKALDIVNIGMIGLCVGMAVLALSLFINFVI